MEGPFCQLRHNQEEGFVQQSQTYTAFQNCYFGEHVRERIACNITFMPHIKNNIFPSQFCDRKQLLDFTKTSELRIKRHYLWINSYCIAVALLASIENIAANWVVLEFPGLKLVCSPTHWNCLLISRTFPAILAQMSHSDFIETLHCWLWIVINRQYFYFCEMFFWIGR